MPRTSVYVLASLVSGVSAALILASGSGYAEARFPQGSAHHLREGRSTCHAGGDGCWTSPYQIANLNSVEDFCLWAPSQPTLSVTEDAEHPLVAWCLKGAHSTRLIPDGVILGARLLITPEYLQITGVGNLSRINVPSWGTAASASGDRSHLVVTSAYGQLEQIHDWTSFVSQDRFCFRACMPSAVASTTCPPVRDVFGCADDAPGSYDVGSFEDCVGDAMKAPSTLFQGVLAASSHDTVHAFSSCTTRRVVGDAARVTHAKRAIACASDCTDTSSTSSPVPTTTDNATTITFPSLMTSTPSSTAYTNSDTPASSAPPVSTAYPSNDTCTLYSHPHWHLHHNSSASFDPPSPSSSSSNVSGCWGAASSNLPLTSSASSPTWSTPPFTPAVSTYSSSDPLSFGTSSSITPSVPAPTFTSSTSTYDSSDPLPVSPTSTSYLSSSLYDSSSLPSSPSFSSSLSDSIASSPSSLASPPLTISSSTSLTLYPVSTSSSSDSSPSSFPTSSQSLWVPILTSSESSTVFTPSSSPSPSPPSSSAPSSVSTFSPSRPSSTLPNSQTQLGSQCPPPSAAAANGAGRPVASQAPFLLSLMLVILTMVSSSSVGVLVLR